MGRAGPGIFLQPGPCSSLRRSQACDTAVRLVRRVTQAGSWLQAAVGHRWRSELMTGKPDFCAFVPTSRWDSTIWRKSRPSSLRRWRRSGLNAEPRRVLQREQPVQLGLLIPREEPGGQRPQNHVQLRGLLQFFGRVDSRVEVGAANHWTVAGEQHTLGRPRG